MIFHLSTDEIVVSIDTPKSIMYSPRRFMKRTLKWIDTFACHSFGVVYDSRGEILDDAQYLANVGQEFLTCRITFIKVPPTTEEFWVKEVGQLLFKYFNRPISIRHAETSKTVWEAK